VTDVDNPDRRESESPTRNYTVPQNQPAGMRIPEFVLRQLISWALKQVRQTLDQPKNIVDELYAMAGPELILQIKEWLRAHENIFIDVAWPRDDQSFPLIVVEPQGEQEETESTFLGDLAGTMDYGRFNDGIPSMRPQFAIPERHTTNVYIASQDDRLTLFLYTLVKFIIISNKDQLTQWYDIHNLTVGGQTIEHDPNLFPTFGYYRVLTLSYLCLFDFNGAEEAAKIVSLDLMVTTINCGDVTQGVEIVTTVPVPFPEP
jgi:hypothetical protein